jgi:hypothetical protein
VRLLYATAGWGRFAQRLVRPGEELTLGAMRRSGVRGVTICCTTCLHLAKLIPDEWPDEAQLADLQQRFVCQECGHKGRILTGIKIH